MPSVTIRFYLLCLLDVKGLRDKSLHNNDDNGYVILKHLFYIICLD